jgi:type III secretory pathway component EscT
VSPLDGELLRTTAGLGLIVARSWAILQAQVLWRSVVGRLWWVLAAGLALLLAPISGPVPVVASLPGWALALAAELALGTAIGTVASLPGYALVGAGAASAAALRVASRPLVAVFALVAMVAALGLGLHRPLLASLTSFQATFPVGQPLAWLPEIEAQGLYVLLEALGGLLVLALSFATPVLLVVVVADVGLRLVGRGPAPAGVLVEPVAIWVRFAGALAALGASWAVFSRGWAQAIAPL